MHLTEKQQLFESPLLIDSSIVSLGLACHLVTAKTRPRTHSFNCEIISRQFIEHRQLFYHLQYEEYACMQDEFMDEMGAV